MRIEKCKSKDRCTVTGHIPGKPETSCRAIVYYEIGDDGYIKRRICKRCGLNEEYTCPNKKNVKAFPVNHRLDKLEKHAKECPICSPEMNPL